MHANRISIKNIFIVTIRKHLRSLRPFDNKQVNKRISRQAVQEFRKCLV